MNAIGFETITLLAITTQKLPFNLEKLMPHYQSVTHTSKRIVVL